MHDSESQRAFIYHAGLDKQLQDQIPFGKPVAQFVPLLVSTLLDYGQLENGRNALESVLEIAKNYVGQDKQTDCERLLQELQATPLERQTVKGVGQEKAITIMSEDEHVFLSYTRKDTAKVQHIRQSLENAGHMVWQDMSAIKGAEEWVHSIADGIKRSYAVVSVVSKASADNRWVRLEYLEAQRRNKRIVPIRIDDCETPLHMLDIHVIDGSSNLNNGINEIIAVLPEVKSIIETEELVNTRQFELDYLDLVLWEYSYWKEVYTPMAGVAQIQSPPQKTRVRRAAAKIKPIFNATFREEIRKAFTSPAEKIEESLDDITTIVDKAKQVVILGDPGSGKTTTMWNLLAKYAEIAKQVKNAPLPILLHLGRLLPYTSVHEQLQEQISHLSLDGLLSHKRIIVLLDALNELPAENRSSKIAELRELVRLAQQDNMIMVVTSRELDYGEDTDLGIENRVAIAPLDPNRIRLFCNNRLPDNGEDLFWQLLGDDAQLVRTFWEAWESQELGSFQAMWEKETLPEGFYSFRPEVKAMRRLRAAIRGESNSRSMLVLASNPYMLCMIADLFAETTQLPQNRGKLLELFTNYLLREREGLDEDETVSLKSQIAAMAYNVQLEKKGINIHRELVLEYLSEDMIYKTISANLIEGGNMLRFSHQLLQEYFAALELNRAIKHGITASTFWTDENWWELSGWEDTVLLLTGLYHDNTTPIIHWLQWTNPEMAARCIIQSGAHTPADVQEKLRAIWLSRLTDIERIPHPKARASIGRALGTLNLDDRSGVGLTFENVPDIVWCEVPEGVFLMGSDRHADTDATNREPELHKLSLPTFYVARYPVTYAQYEAFVSDDGYTNRDYWTKAGWEWKGEWRTPTLYWNEPWWHIANHPVIGVTWYEAFAFTRWLSQKLGYEVRLPTEAEYEKAARGVDGFIYPYGDKLDLNKSNAFENIGRTSAVGIFPSGNSPYNVSDMSGNVFEWCLSSWSNPYKHHTVHQVDIESQERRVVRGGAWNRTFDNCVRAAFRGRSDPFACFYLNGFRVYADGKVR